MSTPATVARAALWLFAAILATDGTSSESAYPVGRDVLAEHGFAVTGGAAPGYIEDRACSAGGCHAELCREFESTDKARSFVRPRAELFVEDFGAVYVHAPSQRHYQVLRDGEALTFRRWQVDETGDRVNLLELPVDFLHGAATLVRTYVYRTPHGELFQLPVAWYVEIGSWGMAPGYDEEHHLGVQRQVRRECQFCHNGISDLPGSDLWGEPDVFPESLPEGIGCQRCHGPGAEHTRLGLAQLEGDPEATEAAVRSSIVNPGNLPPRRHDDVCTQCHARTTLMVPGLVRFDRGLFSFLPGEPLSDYLVEVDITTDRALPPGRLGAISQPARTEASRCFSASGGALTCTTCHDSHRRIPDAEKAAHYRAACETCHPAGTCTAEAAEVATAANDCVACHMPKRPSNVNHFPVTDHLVERRPGRDPAPSFRRVVPIVTDARTVGLEGGPAELYRAAILVDASGSAEAVSYLERMLAVVQPSQLTPRLILAKGQLLQRRWRALELTAGDVLERDPEQRLALEWLGLARAAQGDVDGAEALLRRSLERRPERVETRFNLGRILLGAGRPAAALPELERAVALRPTLAVAWYSLGETLAALERPEEAADAYRRALAVEPNHDRSYLALGRLLLALARGDEARRLWRHGVRVARHPDALGAALEQEFGERLTVIQSERP